MEMIFIVSVISLAAVAITALIIINRNQVAIKSIEKKIATTRITLPLRLQAYERCLVFLERITPDSLLVRAGQTETVQELQSKLLSSIRSEFEHNLSQQIYISQEGWTYIVNAKNNTVGLINSCSAKLNPTEKGLDLARLILESYANLDSPISASARVKLKQEVAQLY
jgi:hypothetical protein